MWNRWSTIGLRVQAIRNIIDTILNELDDIEEALTGADG